MIILITLILIFVVYVCYMMYFKEYVDVTKTFKLLEKTLDTRDLLVLKILPEVKLKKLTGKIAMLIDKRMKEKKKSYTKKIYTDVELNKELKNLYEELNKITSNPAIAETFKNIISLEKSLKNLREEYNLLVDKYNHNLVTHKFVCMRVIRMRPLDKYKSKSLS